MGWKYRAHNVKLERVVLKRARKQSLSPVGHFNLDIDQQGLFYITQEMKFHDFSMTFHDHF